MLKGTYYFRNVVYVVGDNYGDLSEAAALYNTVTFDGNGNYSISGILADSNNYSLEAGTITGTYSIAASGYGFISNPLVTGAYIYGLVSQSGIFVGSSTESGYNDLFIAAPVASPAATNATLKGSYTISNFDVSAALQDGVAYVIGSSFTVNPDGAGNLGTFTMTGYVGGSGASPYTQVATAIKYAFSNGAASFTIPTSANATLMEGQQYIYISPDGNFIFGGSPNSWNFFVGVRTDSTSTGNFNGLYYQAGVDEDESSVATSGYGLLDTYFGSLSAANGTMLGHQRQNDVFFNSAVGYTYSDTYSTTSASYTSADGYTKYTTGGSGTIRIGTGIGPYLGLSVALAAPQVTGSGVWVNPQGIVNAGSFAPFTAGISPGELITIFGSGLAPGTQVASSIPFPTNLNGVQVNINGLPAPLYYVTAGQIAAIVPYATSGGSVATISVNNNGATSNTVTALINLTTPGVLTQTQNGLGPGSILHASNYALVTENNPAQAGETVAVYLTGLGAVNPSIPDGSAGPSSPTSNATNTISADITGTTATVGFAGLAPTLAGLYQVNLTIPSGLTSGDNVLDIEGPDSYTSEAIIPIGTGSGATTSLEPAAAKPALAHRRRPQLAGKPALRRTDRTCLGLGGVCAGRQ